MRFFWLLSETSVDIEKTSRAEYKLFSADTYRDYSPNTVSYNFEAKSAFCCNFDAFWRIFGEIAQQEIDKNGILPIDFCSFA